MENWFINQFSLPSSMTFIRMLAKLDEGVEAGLGVVDPGLGGRLANGGGRGLNKSLLRSKRILE